jgi:hypothetical protein
VIARIPNDPQLLFEKATMLYNEGKMKEALGYIQSLEVQPGNGK